MCSVFYAWSFALQSSNIYHVVCKFITCKFVLSCYRNCLTIPWAVGIPATQLLPALIWPAAPAGAACLLLHLACHCQQPTCKYAWVLAPPASLS